MRYFSAAVCSVSVAIGLCAASAAFAQELPAGVFQMKDGRYYQPSTGIMATSTEAFGISAVSSTVADVATSTPAVVPEESFPLLRAVERGQQTLREAIALAGTGKLRTEKTEPDWRRVTLAIWNPKTDGIRLVTADKKGTDLRAVKDGGDISDIDVTYANGLNSSFKIAGSAGEVAVAIRYPIYTARAISKKKKVYDTQEVVYTPYSPALATPQMIEEGKRWFDATIANVYATVKAKGVRSRAFPDKLVADTLDPALVKSIILIEHLDVGSLKLNAPQLNPLYVTLATNKDASFGYSRSAVGALGIVQFMPKTYAAVAKWQAYGLDANFETGMRNAKNAMTAEVAYLDYLLACLPKETIASYATNKNTVHEYVAAAYNGGATRAVKAMAAWEENLDPAERLHVRTRSRLRVETMQYVLKLRQVIKAIAPTTQVS